jgi:hypothetical protein
VTRPSQLASPGTGGGVAVAVEGGGVAVTSAVSIGDGLGVPVRAGLIVCVTDGVDAWEGLTVRLTVDVRVALGAAVSVLAAVRVGDGLGTVVAVDVGLLAWVADAVAVGDKLTVGVTVGVRVAVDDAVAVAEAV